MHQKQEISAEEYETSEDETSGQYQVKTASSDSTAVVIETKLPTPGVCYTWGGVHYKTFDDRIYR